MSSAQCRRVAAKVWSIKIKIIFLGLGVYIFFPIKTLKRFTELSGSLKEIN